MINLSTVLDDQQLLLLVESYGRVFARLGSLI
jgi:hypothetical protein